jgi:hypothetical protein
VVPTPPPRGRPRGRPRGSGRGGARQTATPHTNAGSSTAATPRPTAATIKPPVVLTIPMYVNIARWRKQCPNTNQYVGRWCLNLSRTASLFFPQTLR